MNILYHKKSKNFNSRGRHKVKMAVVHYTAGSQEGDLKVLCGETKKRVSSHYYIIKNGDIYNLVDEKYNAWHAGLSKWKGYEINYGSRWRPQWCVNPTSVGIEIENRNFEPYTEEQIKSVIELLRDIKIKYNLKPDEIVGHNEISPGRKIDPGPHFPWDRVKREVFATEKQRQDSQIPVEWAKEAWEWSKQFTYYKTDSNGFVKREGNGKKIQKKGLLTKNPHEFVTREELAVILKRYYNKT